MWWSPGWGPLAECPSVPISHRLDILHMVAMWQKNFKRIVSMGRGFWGSGEKFLGAEGGLGGEGSQGGEGEVWRGVWRWRGRLWGGEGGLGRGWGGLGGREEVGG